ncbi:S41 family peptidase [Acetobacterium sp.]|uniref:S41 family peptidase n=1 Tax=Acetobacterium sp. TaxID=1872094 RepID=UPI002F42666A
MQKREIRTLIVIVILVLVAASGLFYLNRHNTEATSENDFSDLTWTMAFEELHDTLSAEYAFTDWKGIDWDHLHQKYLVKMEEAQENGDFNAYYLNLKAYLNEIPDGHVRMNNLKEIDDTYIGGGFGLALAEINDGEVIVTWVDESSPAWSAGIRPGRVLVSWNGQPIKVAVDDVATLFGGTSATTENLRIKKLIYLVRAPIGKQIELEYKNPGYLLADSVSLAAYDDDGLSLGKKYPDSVIPDKLRDMFLDVDNPDPVPDSMVETKLVDDNISYIKISGELDADLHETGNPESTLKLMGNAIEAAQQNDTKGIILDLRNNIGGLDQMTADILGYFYNQKTFFEYQNLYNPDTNAFELQSMEDGSQALTIEPSEPYFSGSVIVLINPKCVSSGEGLAMGLQNLPNAETLGFYGTNGSFGLAGSEAKMPGEITVHWPSGQSLNENKAIQLDSQKGIGGVSPDIKIPMNAQNAIRIANGEDVELEEAINALRIRLNNN